MRRTDSGDGQREVGAWAGGPAAVIPALALAGVAVLAVRQGRRPAGNDSPAGRRRAFAAYLLDHLTGADAAIHLVKGLARDGADRHHALFARLLVEIHEDRDMVSRLLVSVGGAPTAVKRLAGQVAGVPLRLLTLHRPRSHGRVHALEALSTGIQGKRCLWRTGQALEPEVRAPGLQTFADLEARAVRQWQVVEDVRLEAVRNGFGARSGR
jgi:hypothetical protein